MASTANWRGSPARLRGLGYQFTVVLLNGRRIANYAFAPRGACYGSIIRVAW
jgi:hypothetical protein